MRREQDRVDSFHSWTLSIITPAELAKAGFYYLGQGDRVACFSCGGQVCIITGTIGFEGNRQRVYKKDLTDGSGKQHSY